MGAIKIYGERNSGTNYLEQLIKHNLDIDLLRYIPSQRAGKYLKYEILSGLLYELNTKQYLGWKHGKPKIRAINKYDSRLLIITITKNPYSFLLSLYKRPYHYRGDRTCSFEFFIKNEWQTILRDNCKEKYFQTPIDLWNVKNKSYLDLGNQTEKEVINIRYEDLVEEPEKIIKRLSQKYELPFASTNQFRNILKSTKGDNQSFSYYKDYYQKELWRKKLQDEDICFINERLDFEVLKAFNYQKILPTIKTGSPTIFAE